MTVRERIHWGCTYDQRTARVRPSDKIEYVQMPCPLWGFAEIMGRSVRLGASSRLGERISFPLFFVITPPFVNRLHSHGEYLAACGVYWSLTERSARHKSYDVLCLLTPPMNQDRGIVVRVLNDLVRLCPVIFGQVLRKVCPNTT